MNRRIRKKREKQQLARAIRELVALAEKRQRRPVIIKPDTVFDYYEIDAADLQEVTE